MTESSKLWEKLTTEVFSTIDEAYLKNFRAPGRNNKFVAWDPYEKSTRYLKFLLYTIAAQQTNEFFEAYKKIGTSHYGNPLGVRYAACDINADYLAAVEEWSFLDANAGLQSVSSIVEIGAGFGRTCHAILTLSPEIEEYTIVDLDPMLDLSQKYMKLVAPEVFKRIRFVSSNDFELQEKLAPDLVINIDSFQEMPPSIIDGYMNRIVRKAKKFYCKNPIGKYLPEIVGMPGIGPERLLDVLSLGRCTNVIDIFCEDELQKARGHYVEKYMPPPPPRYLDWSRSIYGKGNEGYGSFPLFSPCAIYARIDCYYLLIHSMVS